MKHWNEFSRDEKIEVGIMGVFALIILILFLHDLFIPYCVTHPYSC
jgi:hypothetical protein